MTCRETANLLPLFLDGELDARQMRAVAMHSMRCPSCESELREMERLQSMVGEAIRKQVEQVDFGPLWPAIERRIGTVRVSWVSRLRARWEEVELGFDLRLPAAVAATALTALAFAWYAQQSSPSQPLGAPLLATADNEAAIERLATTFESIDVFNDPASNSTILWVSDEGPLREMP